MGKCPVFDSVASPGELEMNERPEIVPAERDCVAAIRIGQVGEVAGIRSMRIFGEFSGEAGA